jgi:hypothetical protein
MAEDIKLVVRTADQTRKAELSLGPASTGGEIVQAAVDNWALPKDTDYTLVNVSTGKALAPHDVLDRSKVKEGDVLEVQPVLVAG